MYKDKYGTVEFLNVLVYNYERYNNYVGFRSKAITEADVYKYNRITGLLSVSNCDNKDVDDPTNLHKFLQENTIKSFESLYGVTIYAEASEYLLTKLLYRIYIDLAPSDSDMDSYPYDNRDGEKLILCGILNAIFPINVDLDLLNNFILINNNRPNLYKHLIYETLSFTYIPYWRDSWALLTRTSNSKRPDHFYSFQEALELISSNNYENQFTARRPKLEYLNPLHTVKCFKYIRRINNM